jgi:hypothetical protein
VTVLWAFWKKDVITVPVAWYSSGKTDLPKKISTYFKESTDYAVFCKCWMPLGFCTHKISESQLKDCLGVLLRDSLVFSVQMFLSTVHVYLVLLMYSNIMLWDLRCKEANFRLS